MDKLSIVTVSYNSKDTIEETIKSVIELDWCNKEYIVIDGGSNDGTVDIIKQYGNSIDYWCSESDGGIYDAMNKGVQKATGEWIAFLNCGDIYYKDAAEWIQNNNSCADVVYGNISLVNEHDEIIKRKAMPLENMLYQMIVHHQAFFVRRKIFEEIGLFDVSYKVVADYDWLLEAYLRGKNFHYVDLFISKYKMGGMSEVEYDTLYQEYMRVCAEKLKNNSSISSTIYDEVLSVKRKQSCYYYIKEELDKHKDDKIRELIISNEKYVKYGNLALWCMGKYGKRMAKYLDWCGIEVSYYVDGKVIDNNDEVYHVASPECLSGFCGLIIITTADDQFQNQIKRRVNAGLCDDCAVITLDDLGEMAYEKQIMDEMKKLAR